MSNSRAKFRCHSVTSHEGGNKTAKLSAAYGNSGENADFTPYTPSGSVEIMITPETKAFELFNPGDEFYVDFTKIEKS